MIPPVLQVVALLAGNHPRITSRTFIRRSPYSFGALSVLDRRCPLSPNVILGGSDLVSWTGVYFKPVLRVFSPTVGGVPSPVLRNLDDHNDVFAPKEQTELFAARDDSARGIYALNTTPVPKSFADLPLPPGPQ